MADIVFVAVIIGFFAVCVAFVLGCDRIVRSGDDGSSDTRGGDVVSADDIIGFILAVLLGGYLVAAFLIPERF